MARFNEALVIMGIIEWVCPAIAAAVKNNKRYRMGYQQIFILAILFLLGTGYTGYLLSINHKRGSKPLEFMRTVHHFSALAGLACFGVYLFTSETNAQLTVGKLLFITAALGGLTLFRVSFPQEQKPMMVIYAHASIAIAALLTSIIGVFN